MRRLLFIAVLVSGCATLKKDQTVCPEYRNLRCGSEVECTYDNGRGCRVCRCASPEPHLAEPEEAQPPR